MTSVRNSEKNMEKKFKTIEKESSSQFLEAIATLYEISIFRYKDRECLAEDYYQIQDNIGIVATSLEDLKQWIVQDAVNGCFCEGQFAKEGSYLTWNEYGACKKYVPKKISDLIHKILIDDSVMVKEE